MSKENLDYLSKVLSRRSFYGLMDLYEKNYVLLSRLIPDLNKIPAKTDSSVVGSPRLYLNIEERCKYTTMLSITYYFEGPEGKKIADPDLHIRIYHDARQAEAVSCMKKGLLPGKMERIPINTSWNTGQSMIDCKWEINLFLEKWLKYSLVQGHRFCPENEIKPVSVVLGAELKSG